MDPLKILYVDDEPDLREIATFALELDPAMELRTYASGQAALDAIDTDPWRPDALLLDVMMPDMDGPTTLIHLRAKPGLEAIPVIFITARAQAHEQQAFLDKGAVGVITKPFDPMTLAMNLRSLLAGK